MATLRDIRRRITSVRNTQQITRAMKLVAASKLRRAQERILEARPYSNKMHEVLSSLALRSEATPQPLLARRDGGRKMLVVISGDKGMCGAFNANIIRRTTDLLRAIGDGEVSVKLIVVGRKVRDFYRRRPVTIQSEYLNFFDRLAYAHAAQIGQELAGLYMHEECDEVTLIYNEFKSIVSQRVTVETLLPIRPLEAPADGGVTDFIYEPSPEAILASLLPKHVEVQVYRALMESLAGEYGARMTAMEAATKNASEMIDLLTLQFNKARQERITRELLEIVGGAESLRQAAGE